MSMKHVHITPHRLIAGGAMAALLCTAALGAEAAQSSGPVPDFSSNGVSWRLNCLKPDGDPCANNTHFLKVPGDAGPGPVLQHPDYPYVHNENKRMADTNNPIL